LPSDDPLWFQNAVIYQLHVRAFFDSNDDGVGDFAGLTSKLDYLQDLGVNTLWLLPFYPSPLRDDGYDIADYTDVNPRYGTLSDFKDFVSAAHARGLKVVTELVLNHTSDQHAWFQQSRQAAPGTKWRDFYVWSDTTDKYKEARIIFKDFEPSNWTWDPVAKAWYWHRFFHHQPDLNFENPAVHTALMRVVDFWFKLGVDGLRLDAVPYLYEEEGTSCENLPRTHDFLKKLRAHVDARYPGRMLLAEANQWPEDAIAYFGDGDECHMCFHFPLMPRLFMALHLENQLPIVDILQQTPPIPGNCQWATFLRNHDELTLEMVTDEERDYMWRVYAHELRARINLGIRRRLAPLLGNDRRKIELLNALLFSLPGTPIVYYGDEIGMGDNIFLGDRDGCRTPMQWNADRNAGFSRANPQRLYLPVNIDPLYRFEAVNVEAQAANSTSLLWWMRRVVNLRKQHKVFGTGALHMLETDNRKVLAFVREDDNERILVCANLSRYPQHLSVDLSRWTGLVPRELFGHTRFPAVAEGRYPLTLSGHGFLWLALEPDRHEPPSAEAPVPEVVSRADWTALLDSPSALTDALPQAVLHRRWYAGKTRSVTHVDVIDAVRIEQSWLMIACFTYSEGEPESYVIPIGFAEGEDAARIEQERAWSILVRIRGKGILYDASADPAFQQRLLLAIARKSRFPGHAGEIAGVATPLFREFKGTGGPPEPTLPRADQSNTSVFYGDRMVLKLYRRVAEGPNPEVELGRFLGETAGFEHAAKVCGLLEYRVPHAESWVIGVLHGYVPNQGDAWAHTLDTLARYYERSLSENGAHPETDDAVLLARRTAEMHRALASGTDRALLPEPFTPHYQRSLYQSMRNRLLEANGVLRRMLPTLPDELRPVAERVLAGEQHLLRRISGIKDMRIDALRTRTHGDYHLGQVLFTGRDFVIVDFEGEPARPLSERRLKRTPLRDVAGMLRSFHYAAWTSLHQQLTRFNLASSPEGIARLEEAARKWVDQVSAAYLSAWTESVGVPPLLPDPPEARAVLLEAYILEKAAYELVYELNNRPHMVRVPLLALDELLEKP
jgi:maltose alpha-D-glucosyltransferase/alpha-amylase